MDGIHDLGGMQGFGPVDHAPAEPVFHEPWEGRARALMEVVLGAVRPNGGEFRHAIERMDPGHYLTSSYYEHWLTAAATLAVEHGLFTREELEARAGGTFPLSGPVLAPPVTDPGPARASPGSMPVTRSGCGTGIRRATPAAPATSAARPACVVRLDGSYSVPDVEAHGTARRRRADLLGAVRRRGTVGRRAARRLRARGPVGQLPGAGMSEGAHHPAAMSPVEQRVAALEALLTERGLIPEGFIEQTIHRYESEIGPMNGARVVARAWADPRYKQRLLADGTAAIAELGFGGAEGDHMVVVENTPAVHNVIVCTLCSCYPWPTLGLPPAWYKDPPYRARMVREPRVLLAEMGCELPEGTEIRVWDSSAEVRYLVLPQRPEGTEGMSEADLAGVVTRDSMIGVARL